MRSWVDTIYGILGKIAAIFSNPQAAIKQATVDDDALEKTRQAVADGIRSNFLRSTSYNGVLWAPVQRGGTPLILSGNLMRQAAAAGGAAQVTETGILALMDSPFYGAFHQHGTKNIVPRPFFGLPEESKTEIAAILGKSIAKQFTGIVQGSQDYQGYLF